MVNGLLEIFLAYKRSREPYSAAQAGLGRDRRVFHRVPMKVACRMSTQVFGLDCVGTTVDISLDGLGLTAAVNWSESGHVRIRLESIDFEADGQIVFRKEETPGFRYGVRFQKTGIFEIVKLRRFLRQNYNGQLTL